MSDYSSPISRAGPFIAGPWHRNYVTYADGVDKYFLPETMPAEEVEVDHSCTRSNLDYTCSVEYGQDGDITGLRHVPVCAALTPSPDNIANWRLLLQKLTRETEDCSDTVEYFHDEHACIPPAVYNLETITSLPFNLQATAGVVHITRLPHYYYYGYSVSYASGYCTAELRFAYQSNSPILLNLTGTAAAASSSIYTFASADAVITYPADNTGTSVESERVYDYEESDSGSASVDVDVDITVTLPARVVPGIVRVYVAVYANASDVGTSEPAEVTLPPTYNLDLDVSPAEHDT